MIDRVTNLPTAKSGEHIRGLVRDQGYRIEDAHGFEVCFIFDQSKDEVARDIARALEQARDRGFEQGIALVRAALGLQ